MKATPSRHLLLTASLLGIATSKNCCAAVSIVDSFDQGGFSMAFPGNPNPVNEPVNLPLALRRDAAFNIRPSAPGTTMTSTLSAATGTLTFVFNGNPVSPNIPLGLDLIYSGGGPHNITRCTDFILGFSELSGVGSLYVEFGSSSGTEGEHRIDLTGPGDVFYSVADVKPNSIHSADSFNILRFVFEARSPEFSFTLDEIRLVPEPSGTLLALVTGASLMTRRRRGDV